MSFDYALTQSTEWQTQANWQSPDTPFMSFKFWQALVDSGAIGEQAGWLVIYIVVHDSESTPLAVMPVFIKGHHQGEFVFDHAWADAYARYGVDYYPRLVTSVPFTPITGQRLWLAEGAKLSGDILQTALAGVDNIAKQINASSWHGLFVNESLAEVGGQVTPPLLERQGCQFLWHNCRHNQQTTADTHQRYQDFDDFLATLTAKKRKNIRAERKKVAKQGIECRLKVGEQISAEDWRTFYHCYVMTYAVRGQRPYLTADFFIQLGETMAEHLLLAQAVDSTGDVIASSLFLYDAPTSPNSTLYGRYWGALAEYDSLHFELCYYQGIEFAIAQGLEYFDPGTQGEHKLIRGFAPTKTHSLHRIYDQRFVPAISDFCEQDREYMRQYRLQAHQALPFNVDHMPDFKG